MAVCRTCGKLYVMGRGSSESAQVSITPTDGGAQLAWGTQF